MAFSFGGNTSSPSFSFGGASSAAASSPFASSAPSGGGLFGSQNTSTGFGGAASQPAFGAASSGAGFSFSSPSTFSTPAASKPGLFGAASTPSMFGNAGKSPGGFSFSPSSTQSFQNAGAMTGFGSAQSQQTAGGNVQLLTKDNRPVAHSSKWDDLSPQAQQYLLELEKTVKKYSQECKQLEDQDHFVSGNDATMDITQQAKIISQNISALSMRETFDTNEVESLRKAAIHLVRHTEAAVYSYKRAIAWRSMTKSSAPVHSMEELGPPMSLPYPFLEETLETFKNKLNAQLQAVHELEVTIKDKKPPKAATPDTSVAALQASISNLHDCVMRVAATIQELDDKVQKAKAKALYDIQRKGGASDPFREAAQNETRIRQKDASLLITKYDDFKSIQNQSMVIPQEAPQPTGIFNTAQNATTPQLLFGRK